MLTPQQHADASQRWICFTRCTSQQHANASQRWICFTRCTSQQHANASQRWICFTRCTSQQHANASQRWICFTRCHTEIEAADQTFYLTQSQYMNTGPNSPSADPIVPGAWQGSHWSTHFEANGMTRPEKRFTAKSGIKPRSAALEADTLPLVFRCGLRSENCPPSLLRVCRKPWQAFTPGVC